MCVCVCVCVRVSVCVCVRCACCSGAVLVQHVSLTNTRSMLISHITRHANGEIRWLPLLLAAMLTTYMLNTRINDAAAGVMCDAGASPMDGCPGWNGDRWNVVAREKKTLLRLLTEEDKVR